MSARAVSHLVLFSLFAAPSGVLALEGGSQVAAQQVAQLYNRPPLDDLDDPRMEPTPAPGPTSVDMRVDRLERELRATTGRIEELQHSVQMLEEQLRAAKQENARLAAPVPGPAPSVAPERRAGPAGRSADAFDPSSNPSAVGAPKPIGTTSPSAPLAPPSHVAAGPALRDVGAPLDVTPPALRSESAVAAPSVVAPSVADVPPAPPTVKDEYEQAVGLMRSGQYEAAEKSLAVFLAKYPKSKYVPAATYGLGESYYLRGRHREAAEKYLEISTKYAQSAQAPEAMLRLGQTLSALGAREQACASFSEVGVKYPGSPARIRDAAQRESKKLQC